MSHTELLPKRGAPCGPSGWIRHVRAPYAPPAGPWDQTVSEPRLNKYSGVLRVISFARNYSFAGLRRPPTASKTSHVSMRLLLLLLWLTTANALGLKAAAGGDETRRELGGQSVARAVELLLYRFNPVKHHFGCDGGGYGCWFLEHDSMSVSRFPVLNVSVDRPLLLTSKSEVYPWVRKTVNSSEIRAFLRPCIRHRTCSAYKHFDTGVCAAARKAGYDSVRMPLESQNNRTVWYNEWVICKGSCLTTVSCDSCPTVVSGVCADPNCCGSNPPGVRWEESLDAFALKQWCRTRRTGVCRTLR